MIYDLRFKNNEKGFTLIELLIVVTIIGVLSSLLTANFIGIRQRTRDAQRKSDLRQIQSALEIYRADQGTYKSNPGITKLNSTDCPDSDALTAGSATYMQKIPCDPIANITYFNRGNYYYSSDGNTYKLVSCMENRDDKDPNITTTAPVPAPGISCATGKYYVLNNP